MQRFDLTLPTPQENLALDEALLDEAEASDAPREALRLWESPQTLVVVGRSSQVALEVNLQECQARNVPVLRRASGGAAIVAGRGCLMYAVVLSYRARPQLRPLDAAHRFVLDTTLAALAPLVAGASRQGTSDLALGQSKFSGNSVRCKRDNFLYHGTLLYDFDLAQIEQLLAMPPRQPDYRRNRAHRTFVANLPVGREAICRALAAAWGAHGGGGDWPRAPVDSLVAEKYGRPDWNFQR